MMNRRHFFASSLGLCALARPAWAAPASRVCKVPSQAMGAIVAATGGTGLRIELDSAMDPRSISLDGKLASVTEALLMKGAGDAQKTFLDDARNAPRVGAAVRDLLAAAEPDRAAEFKDMHRAWARPWARRCIDWGKTLEGKGLKGKKLQDGGRPYLLEWAGATLDPKGGAAPGGLAKAPEDATAPLLDAYAAYIDRLIGALS